jgi:hypothetical protein
LSFGTPNKTGYLRYKKSKKAWRVLWVVFEPDTRTICLFKTERVTIHSSFLLHKQHTVIFHSFFINNTIMVSVHSFFINNTIMELFE